MIDKSNDVQAQAKTKELEDCQSADNKTIQELHTEILGKDARSKAIQELHDSDIIKNNKEPHTGVIMHVDCKKSNVVITIE